MAEKHYPTDPRGQEDAGIERDTRWPKPCARRIDPGPLLALLPVRWCLLGEGHEGACSAPVYRATTLAPSSKYALRLRGLQRDQFADKFTARTKGKL